MELRHSILPARRSLGDGLNNVVTNRFFGIIPATSSLGQRTTTAGPVEVLGSGGIGDLASRRKNAARLGAKRYT